MVAGWSWSLVLGRSGPGSARGPSSRMCWRILRSGGPAAAGPGRTARGAPWGSTAAGVGTGAGGGTGGGIASPPGDEAGRVSVQPAGVRVVPRLDFYYTGDHPDRPNSASMVSKTRWRLWRRDETGGVRVVPSFCFKSEVDHPDGRARAAAGRRGVRVVPRFIFYYAATTLTARTRPRPRPTPRRGVSGWSRQP